MCLSVEVCVCVWWRVVRGEGKWRGGLGISENLLLGGCLTIFFSLISGFVEN